MVENLGVSIMVPNYNGRDLLEKYLPSVLECAHEYPGPVEIIVVDDGSQDGSVDFVAAHFPDVRLIRMDRNVGALAAKNAGFSAARHELIACLNNDVQLQPGFLAPLARLFVDPDLFGAGARVLLMNAGMRDEGVTFGEWRRGQFQVLQPGLWDATYACDSVQTILYPHGGACLYSREKLLALGGYDRLLHPIYWDDLDVGYAAWKRGWRCLYQPASVALHQHMATTLRTTRRRQISALMERNMLLFTWKNITDGPLVRSHLAWLGLRLAGSLPRGKPGFYRDLRAALPRLPSALRARRRESGWRRLSDRQVLELLGGRTEAASAG